MDFTAVYEFLGSLIGNTRKVLLKLVRVALFKGRPEEVASVPWLASVLATNQEHIPSE